MNTYDQFRGQLDLVLDQMNVDLGANRHERLENSKTSISKLKLILDKALQLIQSSYQNSSQILKIKQESESQITFIRK